MPAITTRRPTCGGASFSAGTKVLLASGAAVAISALKVGDKVLAASTKTAKTTPETVAAVLVHHDTDLYDLTVKTSRPDRGHPHHVQPPVLGPSLNQWVAATKLGKGEHLKTANGTVATADGGTPPADHDGWMWDLTVPGNNDHDFYVVGNVATVLVHNSTSRGQAGASRGPHGLSMKALRALA